MVSPLSLKMMAGQVLAKQSCLGLLLLLCHYEDDLLQYIICWLSMQQLLTFSMGLGQHHRVPMSPPSEYQTFIVDLYNVKIDPDWTEEIFTTYFSSDQLSKSWLEWLDSACRIKMLKTFFESCLVYSDIQLNSILFVQQFCLHLYIQVMQKPTLYHVTKMHLFFYQGMACPILMLNTLTQMNRYTTFEKVLLHTGNLGDVQRLLSPYHRQLHLMKIIFMQDCFISPPISRLPCPDVSALTLEQQTWLKANCKYVPKIVKPKHFDCLKWYVCEHVLYPVLDPTSRILKYILAGLAHMRLGRFYFAIIFWYSALTMIDQEKPKTMLHSFKCWIMCKCIQSFMALKTPLGQLLPLFQSACQYAEQETDHNVLFQTSHLLLAEYNCGKLSLSWMNTLTMPHSHFQHRFAFETLIHHVRESFYRLENYLALDLLRISHLEPYHMRRSALSTFNLNRFQKIKSILNRIYFLISQKLKPALQRFYFNRYMSSIIEALTLEYDVFCIIVKKQKVDIQWTTNMFTKDIVELRSRISTILGLIPKYDSLFGRLSSFKYALDRRFDDNSILSHYLELRIDYIWSRTLQEKGSYEEADYFFTWGVLSYGLNLNQNSYNYFTQALSHYQYQSNINHSRIALCELLSKIEQNHSNHQELYQQLLDFDMMSLCTNQDHVKQILKMVHSTTSKTVQPRPSNEQHSFSFNYLKTIPAFVSAFQFYCPHDFKRIQ